MKILKGSVQERHLYRFRHEICCANSYLCEKMFLCFFSSSRQKHMDKPARKPPFPPTPLSLSLRLQTKCRISIPNIGGGEVDFHVWSPVLPRPKKSFEAEAFHYERVTNEHLMWSRSTFLYSWTPLFRTRQSWTPHCLEQKRMSLGFALVLSVNMPNCFLLPFR